MATEVPLSSLRVRIDDNAVSRQVGSDYVILHLQTGEYFGLDDTGARIFELCQQFNDPAMIFRQMCEEYDVAPETLEADLRRFLADLEQAGILKLDHKHATETERAP